MTTLKMTWSLLLTGALVTAACGDSKSSMLPTAPSAVGAETQSIETGDAGVEFDVTAGKGKEKDKGKDDKNKNDNGNGNGKQPTSPLLPSVPGVTPPTNTTPPVPSTKTVQLEGTISLKTSNAITVNSQVVSVPSSAVIRHGSKTYKFSDLRVGNRVHVKATRMAATTLVAPSATTLVASEVKVQNPADPRDSGEEDPAANMLVSVTASDPSASEGGLNEGVFTVTRAGDTTAALVVTFTLTGSATHGTDYQTDPVTTPLTVPLTVTIPAGMASATVKVKPTADDASEAPETVILTVVDGDGYTAGAPATATVNIVG
jgi:Domain of unknown function (DUF5666)